jgi:hypothetical protein
MKSELTPEEQTALEAFRADAFARATSTVTDRPRAEAAICRLYELAGHQKPECIWVASPEAGDEEYEGRVGAVVESPWGAFKDSLAGSLNASPWDSLRDSLKASLRLSLSGSFEDSLSGSLAGALNDSLVDSLRASFVDSFWDSSWIAFLRFSEKHLGAVYSPEVSEHLRITGDLLDSCFAAWAGPGWVVLCDRPTAVESKDGKLVEMKFGGAS